MGKGPTAEDEGSDGEQGVEDPDMQASPLHGLLLLSEVLGWARTISGGPRC